MTWDTRFRMLAKGEIVEKGDEVDACADGWRDPPDWQPATHMSIGKPAPDPQFPAHRRFRRLVSNVGSDASASSPIASTSLLGEEVNDG